MLNIRTVILSIMLVFTLMLTVGEAVATGGIALSTNVANQSAITRTEIMDCFSLPSRYSLRTEHLKGTDLWIPYTEDGPAGVDGGMKELMSAYRTCSRSK